MDNEKTDKKPNIFEGLASKEISNESDARNAIESAGQRIQELFSNAMSDLSSIQSKDGEESQDPEDVLKVLDGIKDTLSHSMDEMQSGLEQLSEDGNLPSEEDVEGALDSLGPDVRRDYDEMMRATQEKIQQLKEKVSSTLQISQDEIDKTSEEATEASKMQKGRHRTFGR